MSTTGLSDCSMLELFRLELEGQSVNLNDGLLALERAPGALEHIEPLMRAAHSLKGAARIVGLDVAVRVAHAMEDFLVAAQHGRVALRQPEIDALLNGVDLLTRIGNTPEPQLAVWEKEQAGEIQSVLDRIKGVLTTGKREDNSPVATLPNTEATVQPAGEVGDGHAQFRAETELQLTALAESLAASNGPPAGPEPLPALISAAQAIKDAARTVNCAAAIRVAHALEDIFTSAQNTDRACQPSEQEAARRAVEWLQQLAASQPAEFSKWEAERAAELETFVDELRTCLLTTPAPVAEPCAAASPASPKRAAKGHEHHERVLRISAENLNRLLGMVGESLVESRWIHPFTSSMLRLKRLQAEIEKSLEDLRESLPRQGSDEKTQHQLHSTQTKVAECRAGAEGRPGLRCRHGQQRGRTVARLRSPDRVPDGSAPTRRGQPRSTFDRRSGKLENECSNQMKTYFP